VLPVGGIKEKILAAHRAGIKRIIMPDRNQKDMVDVPQQAKDEMEFFYVKKIDELLPLALTEMPEKYGKPQTPPVVVTPPAPSSTNVPPTGTPS
jgi:ATP-dependent Lon protease